MTWVSVIFDILCATTFVAGVITIAIAMGY